MNTITQQANQWHVSGDLLMDNVSGLLVQSAALSMEGDVAVDFSAVTDADTAALSLIMEWQRRARASSCKVTFTNLPENLSSLAELYGVTDFIPTTTN